MTPRQRADRPAASRRQGAGRLAAPAVRLRVDHVEVTAGSPAQAASIEATVRAALEILAGRLAATPPRGGMGRTRIERLTPIDAAGLAAPGGAARLADLIYASIRSGGDAR